MITYGINVYGLKEKKPLTELCQEHSSLEEAVRSIRMKQKCPCCKNELEYIQAEEWGEDDYLFCPKCGKTFDLIRED